ncbi:C-4 methylsterol oxidase [Aureococcus anophagefferens]|nr:C-4 methylsterol oxidase [Aureococcus anophagefferens]
MVVVDLPALPDERGRWGAEGEDSWGDAVAWLAREPGAFRPPGPPRVVAFVAHNGLCNRLAGLGGLWALADHDGAAFELLWEGEIACQGAFSELYDDADGLAVVDGARVQELRDAPDCWVFDTKRASHFWTAPWTFLLSTEAGAPDFASFDARAALPRRLAPSAAVRGAVNGFLSLGPWGSWTCRGARFHDGFAAYASTVDRFEAEIGALLRGAAPDPGHPVVFLAADARGTVDRVLATFRAAADDGRLVVLDKRFATPHACLKVVRHTSSVDALADLYLLARCTSILGTFQSSFSELAAVLGGVPARCPGLPPRLRASLNLYAAVRATAAVAAHDGPAPELAGEPRPPTVIAPRAALLKLPRDGGGRFRVRGAKGALVRDHVEQTGALVGVLRPGEDASRPNFVWLSIAAVVWCACPYDLAAASEWRRGWMLRRLAVNFVTTFGYVGFWHAALYVWGCSERKFMPNVFPDASRMLHNVWYSVLAVVQWTAWECVYMRGAARGTLPTHALDSSGAYVRLALWIVAIPLYRGAHFYFAHRLIHVKPLYKFVHSLHHRNIDIEPFAGLCMHPVEHLFYFSCVGPSLYCRAHPFVFWWNGVHLLLSPAASHSGWEDHLQSDQFHMLHHRRFECNYGSASFPLDHPSARDCLHGSSKTYGARATRPPRPRRRRTAQWRGRRRTRRTRRCRRAPGSRGI